MTGRNEFTLGAPDRRRLATSMLLGKIYLAFIAVLLIGYAFFDKGFAYIGYAPVYIGELALVAGIFVFFAGGGSFTVFRSPITWAILAFALWGALNTFPYLGVYGVFALRDGVVWAYATFALTVAAALLRTGLIERTLAWYGRWLPLFLIWAPIAFLLSIHYRDALPLIPGSQLPVLTLKPGDIAVHLAGAAAFLILGLHRWFPRRPGAWLWLREWGWWLFWSLGFIAVGARSRAALLAMLAAVGVVMALRPSGRLYRLLLAGIVIFALSIIIDVNIPLGNGRVMSPQQIFLNMESVFFKTQKLELFGTTEWRLEWWRTILDYTVFGDYFWTGKGYGINLADSDGFQVVQEGSLLRSPHNSHLTFLARSGIPGLALWFFLQVTIFFSLLRAYFRSRRAGRTLLANVILWVLAYWTAFIVNMGFDVYLEGPQGGIWFWSLIGFAIALIESEKRKVPAQAPLPPARALAGGGLPSGDRRDV